MFDKNGNGRISMAELGEMMTNLGKNVPSKVNKSFGAVFSESLWLYGYGGKQVQSAITLLAFNS